MADEFRLFYKITLHQIDPDPLRCGQELGALYNMNFNFNFLPVIRYMMLIDGRDEIYFADRDNCIFQVKVAVVSLTNLC